MPLTRTTSGKLWHYDLTSMTDWSSVTAGGGTVVQAGSIVTCTATAADADVAFMVLDNELSAYLPCVVRTRSKFTSMATNSRHIACLDVYQNATKPAAAYVHTNLPRLSYYRGGTGTLYWYSAWGLTVGSATPPVINTYYCQEIFWDGTDCLFQHWSDSYGVIHETQTKLAYSYSNNLWLVVGDYSSGTVCRGEIVTDYVQAFENLTVTITGLGVGSGRAVRLYNSSGTLIASAVEAGAGTATLDLESVANFDTNTNPTTADGGFKGYIRIFTDNTYTTIEDVDAFDDIFGGDIYDWEAPAPAPTVTYVEGRAREWRHGLEVKIYNNDGSEMRSVLKEHAEHGSVNVFENMSLETCNPGGFTVATFDVRRIVTQQWRDLEPYNHVLINDGPNSVWEGYIDTPARSISPDNIAVHCLGWSSRLNEMGATSDITAPGGGYQGSTFITGVLLVAITELTAGDINTGDYAYPVASKFEFSPWTPFFDCLEQFNQGNDYNWGVWENKALSWTPKTPTVIDWLVKTSDCIDLTITPNPDTFCNRVLVSYTQDGVHNQVLTLNDTTSQAVYGRIVEKELSIPTRISTAGATVIGNLYLATAATMRVSAEFTCTRIFDLYGNEHHLSEARGGDNIRLGDWLPTEDLLTGVTDIATFQIKSTIYDHTRYSLQITPTEPIPQSEIQISRLGMRAY